MYICIGKLIITGSDNGLSSGRCQTIIWTNAGILLIGPLGRNCSEILHDDIIKWKHFPHYWPFVRRIHRSPVNSLHKGQWRGTLMFSLICAWINSWVNKLWGWWFETPSCSLFTEDKATLVQVKAWCHQGTSDYLNQCWPRSLSPYDVTRPQWVKNQQKIITLLSIILPQQWCNIVMSEGLSLPLITSVVTVESYS